LFAHPDLKVPKYGGMQETGVLIKREEQQKGKSSKPGFKFGLESAEGEGMKKNLNGANVASTENGA
jgi:hypothetical protein